MSITSPLDISGCVRWLKPGTGFFDATTGGNAVVDGGSVTRWADQSGNGNDLVQATADNQPRLTGAAVSLEYAHNEYLSGSNPFASQSFSVFYVLGLTNLRRSNAAGINQAQRMLLQASNFTWGMVNGSGQWSLNNAGSIATNPTFSPTSQCLFGLVSGSSGASMVINEDVRSMPALGNDTAAGSAYLGFPTGYGVTAPAQANASEIVCYDRALTTQEIADLQAYYRAHGALFAADAPYNLVIDGDSISAGAQNALNKNWVRQLGLPANCLQWNLAEAGQTMATIQSQLSARLLPLYQPGKTNLAVVWASTNDIVSGTSAATAFNNYQAVGTACKAAGFPFVAGTMLPRTDCTGAAETQRQAFNAALLSAFASGAPSWADSLVDLTSEAGLQDPTNSAMFPDGVHPNNAATALIANHFRTAIASVIPFVPVITSPATATGTVGTAFSYQITATNSPASFAATGLPAGVQLDTITGEIHGTPTVAGAYAINLSATNAGGTGTGTLASTVSAAPVVPGSGGLTVAQAAQLAMIPGLVTQISALAARLALIPAKGDAPHAVLNADTHVFANLQITDANPG